MAVSTASASPGTTVSAWFTGDTGRKDAITPGRLADFTVLDRDYVAATDAEIAKLKTDPNIVNGEVVYGAGAFATENLTHATPISPDWSPVISQGRDI